MVGDPFQVEDEAPRMWRDMVRSALVYWEPRRLVFNLVLLAVTLWVSRGLLGGHLAELVIACAGANVCYCAAYPLDLLSQWTGLGTRWLRPLLLLCGCVLGAAMASAYTNLMLHPGM